MKNNKIIFLSILALVGFTSCQKTQRIDVEQEKNQTKITVKLGEYIPSKSVGDATTATPVKVGPSFKIEDFDASDLILGSANVDFTASGNTFTATTTMNSNSTSVKITGNYDGTSVGVLIDGKPSLVTLSSNVNTRQGNVTEAVVLVSGTGTIEAGTPKTSAITVGPEMARIEIQHDPAASSSTVNNLKDVKITTFMLNNTKIDRADLTADRTISSEFINIYKPDGNKSRLYDYIAATLNPRKAEASISPLSSPPIFPDAIEGWNVINGSGLVSANILLGKSIGYNIFPQVGGATKDEAKANHPHIIIGISYYEKDDNNAWSNKKEGFINITALKTDATTYVANFEAGKVYILNISDIVAIITKIPTTTPVTLTPDPLEESVDITCTVGSWVLQPVIPEV